MRTLQPEPGVEIEGFRLVAPLHRGGMGAIWLAVRAGDGQEAVVKVPYLGEGEEASAIIGFELERMILPRLTGLHVPKVFAAGDAQGLPFIAMERLPGRNLEEQRKADALSIPQIANLGARIAAGLQDLHGQNVVHLDLKPANVMFRPDGQAVFLDFGLARHDELPDLLAEESDQPMGTGAYIAPEQILGYRGDPRSDIFALGVILYELVTGSLPFGSPQRAPGMRKRLWRDPKPPRALNPDCPPWLQEIILRCLEVHPGRRFASAAQLGFALQNPDQVTLTERAERMAQDGPMTVLKRWIQSRNAQLISRRRVADLLERAPIVVVAVDLSPAQQALAERLRVYARRVLETEPSARLACVTVRKTALVSIDSTLDEEGNNIYLGRLIELKDWARPLGLAEDKVSFHVLEAVDPADALIDYARHNQVEHLLVGARASSSLRRYLGSVSAKVVAEAPCTVTVVRLRDAPPSGEEAT